MSLPPDVTTKDSADVLYSESGAIGHIVLNRPRARNALTFAMYDRIAEICATIPSNGTLRAMIISGAGGKAFAAGTDISQFRDFKGAADGLTYEANMSQRLAKIESCPIPTIAAISGACTGGGAAIAACCDLRIASADVRFGFPIARTLGNCLSAANLAKLASIIGPAKTTEMILTSRLLDAAECKSAGLVSEICPDHEAVVARAYQLAADVAGMAPITLRVTKELMRRIGNDGAKAHDHDQIALAYGSADFREGLESFLAKRLPNWRGE